MNKLLLSVSGCCTLREALLEDAAIIYQAIATHRKYLETWLPFVTDLTEAGEEEFLSTTLAVEYERRNIVYIIEKEGKLCGLVGFVYTDDTNHRTEIGYWLLPEYQKQGIMTQCVRSLCQWAFEKRQMNRIQIRCAAKNDSSNAIPIRLGFQLEGTERESELLACGQYTDINVYG